MNATHLLICVQNITPATRQAMVAGIQASASSWWNHLDNVWIVCVPNDPGVFDRWAQWVTGLVKKDDGRVLVIELAKNQNINGFLPQAAWPWLKGHGISNH